MEPGSEHWQSRFKCEQILEVACPKCGAASHKWCDRAGEKLSKHGQALRKAGTPPSHQERMWSRQGHAEHEFPALLARQRPGLWDEPPPRTVPAVAAAFVRTDCGPCKRERAIRADLRSAAFPVDFECKHPPAPSSLPPYPQRYHCERPCPECKSSLDVEVIVQDPKTVGYRCDRGHMWLAKAARRPVAVGVPVVGDGEGAPWEA